VPEVTGPRLLTVGIHDTSLYVQIQTVSLACTTLVDTAKFGRELIRTSFSFSQAALQIPPDPAVLEIGLTHGFVE
jgi:hypothetical protein